MRIFKPLMKDHPLVIGNKYGEKEKCALCHKFFLESQRTTLIPLPETEEGNICKAIVAHANCYFIGKETPMGVIERVKDGYGSPYPILTVNNGQFTLKECGLE